MRTQRGRAAAVAVALVVLGAACGNDDGGSGAARDGLPKLPASSGGAADSSAMSAEVASDADRSSLIAPARHVEYRLADGAEAPAQTATAYEVKAPPWEVRNRVQEALGHVGGQSVDQDQVNVGERSFDWYYSGAGPDTVVSSTNAAGCAPDAKCELPEATPPTTVPGVPSADDARTRATGLFERLGFDDDDGTVAVDGVDGQFRTVSFTPSVGGFPVPSMQTNVTFGAEGRILYASGFVGTFEAAGEYPLVSLATALERFQQGFGGGVATMDARATGAEPASGSEGGGSSGAVGGDPGSGASVAEPTPADVGPSEPTCEEGKPCSIPPSPPAHDPPMTIEPDPSPPPVPLEPQVVDVTGAQLVLQLAGGACADDPMFLVPAFELQPGPLATVTAVADDALAGSDPDEPVEPCPGAPDPEVPVGKPEPAPMPPDAGREPARP